MLCCADAAVAAAALQACSVVLRVAKSRTPLLQAAKVLYRLSKDTGNDALFKREGLLEPMLSTVHVMVLHSSSGGGTSMHEVSWCTVLHPNVFGTAVVGGSDFN